MGAEVIPFIAVRYAKDACNERLRATGPVVTKPRTICSARRQDRIPRSHHRSRVPQRMIGEETKAQISTKRAVCQMPLSLCRWRLKRYRDVCDFINDTSVGLIGVEPAVTVLPGEHGAPLKHGRVGIYFGMKAPMINSDGQIEESYSISAGLDFRPLGRNTCVPEQHRTRGLCLHYR